MILRKCLPTICAAMLLSGCGNLYGLLGKIGANVTDAGGRVAHAQGAPKARTEAVAEKQGGYFCPNMKRLGWPNHLRQSSIDTLDDAELRPIVGANRLVSECARH